MESTLEVARRAVEADTRRDWASGAKRSSAAHCRAAHRVRRLCARCNALCGSSSARRMRMPCAVRLHRARLSRATR